jgi:serine/threonine protein kinase
MSQSPVVLQSLVTAGAVIGGKYRLVERLGEGGIAEVWEAVNVDLDAPVAVKVCRPNSADPTSVQRLIQEARAAARLMHPSIVRVYDTGLTEHGAPYVVMERLQGVNLRAEIEREGPIDLLYVVNTMIAVADALELAHRHGIVHRDVKPDNIFLAEVDAGRVQPKLLDFGIIKIEGYSANLTKTGTTLGSPAYMAPEQAAGELDVDARADVWSACVVLFEAMTGRLPFEAANYNALMRSILTEPVPNVIASFELAGVLTPFSVAIARVVQRGLEKERSARWQTAAALRDALSDCVQLVLPKESASHGNITAYHLVRASTVPRDAPTINQWSGAHESVREASNVSSRWRGLLTAGALLLSGGALALYVMSTLDPGSGPSSAEPPTAAKPSAERPTVAKPSAEPPSEEKPSERVFVKGERSMENQRLTPVAIGAPTQSPPTGAADEPAMSAGSSPGVVTPNPKARGAKGGAPKVKPSNDAKSDPTNDLGLKEAY